MAYINFTSFVTNDDIEAATEKTVKNFDCIVEVFRSKDNCGGGWGKNDNTYKQNFGFDRYNPETSGKGLGATRSFKFMHFLKNSSDGIISYVYYIPWLCIWPPKASLQDFYKKNSSKKEEGKWIDPSFIPVTEAELFCRIDGGKDKKKDSGDLVFISNSEHLKVEGGKTYSLTGKSVKDEFSIKISCSGVIKNDPKNPPKIEIRETGEKGAIVGQINVVPNDEIYFGRVFFVPIEEEKKEAKRKGQAERRKQNKEEFEKQVQEILEYLNTKSFNQALIYFDAEASEIITFPKNLIKSGNTGEYSASVSKAYFQGVPGTDDSEHKKKLKESEKELDKAILKYFKAIKKNYNQYKKTEVDYSSKVMNAVDFKVKKDFEERFNNYLIIKNKEILVGGHNRDTDKIYVFIDKDRNVLSQGGMQYGGYAYMGGTDAYIFNKSLNDKNYGVISHEIAHCFGLGHIYEMGSGEINKKLEEKIKEEKKEQKYTDNAKKSTVENVSNISNREDFNKRFKLLEKMTTNKKGYTSHMKEIEYYYQINSIFTILNLKAQIKDNNQNSSTPVSGQVSKIAQYEKEIQGNLNRAIDISMSNSLENYMDYDTYIIDNSSAAGIDIKSENNESFCYKSFNKWQWDTMKGSKILIKKELK